MPTRPPIAFVDGARQPERAPGVVEISVQIADRDDPIRGRPRQPSRQHDVAGRTRLPDDPFVFWLLNPGSVAACGAKLSREQHTGQDPTQRTNSRPHGKILPSPAAACSARRLDWTPDHLVAYSTSRT